DFELGRAIEVCPGDDVTLISTGGLLETAVQTSAILQASGLNARVLSVHTVKPLDQHAILRAARETRAIFTLEEHSIVGGLGGAVAEVLAESEEHSAIFRRFGLPAGFCCTVGTQEYLRAQFGLTSEALARSVMMAVGKATL